MRIRLRRVALAGWLGLALALSLLPAAAAAAPGNAVRRAVVVVVPDLSWSDVTAPVPSLRNFTNRAAWASVNVRGGNATRVASYLTLGAGAQAEATGPPEAYDAAEVTPEGVAASVLLRRTGVEAPAGAVVVPRMAALERANANLGGGPGALGDLLRSAGIQTAVWGNADIPGQVERGAAVMLADRRGLVAMGDVSERTLRMRADAPYGIDTDLDELRRWWRSLPAPDAGGPRFVAIEDGDLWRQRSYAAWTTDAVAAAQRAAALHRLGDLLAFLMSSLDPSRDALVLLSPVPREATGLAQDTLTPFAVWGRPGGPGLVVSPSTRRPGLVTASDLLPTVAAWFGLTAPVEATGRPAYVVPASVAAAGIPGASDGATLARQVHDRSVAIDRLRPELIKGWILVYLVAVATAGIALVAGRRPLRWVGWLFLLLAAFGPGTLLAVGSPWPPWRGLASGVADTAGAALLLVFLSAWVGARVWRRPVGGLYALSLVAAALLTADALRAGAWTRWSYLGYSALSGARFYGIGNEFMGVWIGAVLVATVGLLERWPRRGHWGALLLMATCVGLLAWPGGGANFGGATAAVLAFVPTYLYAVRRRIDWLDLFWAALGFVGVAALMVTLDIILGRGHPSHVGRLALEVWHAGPAPLVRIAVGKLAMEWRLIQLTIWTKLLAVFLASSAMLMLWSPEPMRRLWAEQPALRVGAFGYALGTFAVIALNDSGVVAAATMLTMVAAAFFGSVSEQLGKP
ncbi:MAG: hypothetical protein IRZ18_02860 [Clostridia bacterium]|nr:hypothetical protein [Clostridia bacterium]